LDKAINEVCSCYGYSQSRVRSPEAISSFILLDQKLTNDAIAMSLQNLKPPSSIIHYKSLEDSKNNEVMVLAKPLNLLNILFCA
jgi:hypothetical protein